MILFFPAVEGDTGRNSVRVDNVLFAVTLFGDDLSKFWMPNGFGLNLLLVSHKINMNRLLRRTIMLFK